MFSVFLSSYRNTRESLGELKKAVETLAGGSCPHSISRSPKRPLVFPFKVAERSFQGPIPNSPLLLNYLCFGARFWQESRAHRSISSRSLARVCAIAMATGLVKNKA